MFLYVMSYGSMLFWALKATFLS